MRKTVFLMKLILVGLLVIPMCSAKLTPDFIDCLAQRIVDDCTNSKEAIGINGDVLAELGMEQATRGNNQTIIEAIKLIDDKYVSGAHGPAIYAESYNFIVCGEKKLQYALQYYWDEIPVSNFCPEREGDTYQTITQIGLLNFFSNLNVDIEVKIVFSISIILNIYFILRIIFKRKMSKSSKYQKSL